MRRIIFLLMLIAASVQRLAGLTSHSLRHRGGVGGRPLELPVRLHEEVLLACDASASVVWMHDGQPLAAAHLGPQGRIRLAQDSLRILRVASQDQGVWSCEERDPQSQQLLTTRAVLLRIIEAPRRVFLRGENGSGGGARLTFREGTEGARVHCEAEGGWPTPTYTWRVECPVEVFDLTGEADILLEKVPREWHNCSLVCAVAHSSLAAPLRAVSRLNVTYSPSFVMSRVPGFGFPLFEGLAVSLKCDVDSNPPSSPKWMKDDSEPPVVQSAEGFLNFSSISRDHVGWYKCVADYESNNFASSGYYLNVRYEGALTKQPPPRQVEVALGGGVTLECGTEGLTTGVPNCWGRVFSNERVETIGAGPQLRLDSVLYQEAGNYRCVAPATPDPLLVQRKALLNEPDIKLVVTGRPVVYPVRRNVTALAGSQLSLAVEFCANPAASHAFWLTRSIVLMPGQQGGGYIAQNLTEGDSELCQRAALTIGGVDAEHAGEYLFMVRSPRGVADGAVTLQVVGSAPRRPTPAPVAVLLTTTPPPPPPPQEVAEEADVAAPTAAPSRPVASGADGGAATTTTLLAVVAAVCFLAV